MLLDMWNRFLIFLHLRRDWAKEIDYAPPAFASVPHVYDPEMDSKTLTYCAQCGAGKRHAIHTVPVDDFDELRKHRVFPSFPKSEQRHS